MLTVWRRLPVVVRAVLSGIALALAGTTPWALLSSANLKYWPVVPWSVPPTLLWLWFFWRYARGEGSPSSTAEARRTNLRANDFPEWGAAIFAGMFGLAAVVLLLRVMNRLVPVPQQQVPDLSGIPGITLLLILAASALVAGVVEEASFRGYMQAPIERRHGPVIAILVTGVFFGFLHFSHPEVTLAMMPYYIAVAAVYGMLAYLTHSIMPSLVLHALGNFFSGLGLLVTRDPRTIESPRPQPLIWQTGTDSDFWVLVIALLLVTAGTVWAYSVLAEVARRQSLRPGQIESQNQIEHSSRSG